MVEPDIVDAHKDAYNDAVALMAKQTLDHDIERRKSIINAIVTNSVWVTYPKLAEVVLVISGAHFKCPIDAMEIAVLGLVNDALENK